MSTVFASDLNNDTFGDIINDKKTYQYANKGTYQYSNKGTGRASLSIADIEKKINRFRSQVLQTPDKIEIIKQEWKGVVLSHDKDTFTARLEDKSNSNYPDEEVILSLEEIPKQEQKLIEPGAMFSWYIGTEKEKNTHESVFLK